MVRLQRCTIGNRACDGRLDVLPQGVGARRRQFGLGRGGIAKGFLVLSDPREPFQGFGQSAKFCREVNQRHSGVELFGLIREL
jgi:hypothetical protein